MTTRKTPEQRLADIDSTRKRLRERVAAGKDPQLAKDIRNIRKVQAAIEARGMVGWLTEEPARCVADLDSMIDAWVDEAVPE